MKGSKHHRQAHQDLEAAACSPGREGGKDSHSSTFQATSPPLTPSEARGPGGLLLPQHPGPAVAGCLGQMPVLTLTSGVRWGKLVDLSVLSLPHPSGGGDSGAYAGDHTLACAQGCRLRKLPRHFPGREPLPVWQALSLVRPAQRSMRRQTSSCALKDGRGTPGGEDMHRS